MTDLIILAGIEDAQWKQRVFEAIDRARPYVGDTIAEWRREYILSRWDDIDNADRFVASCKAMISLCAHNECNEVIGTE